MTTLAQQYVDDHGEMAQGQVTSDIAPAMRAAGAEMTLQTFDDALFTFPDGSILRVEEVHGDQFGLRLSVATAQVS